MATCIIDEELTIEDLVRAAQTGDRDAFGELFERYEHYVFAIGLRRLGNHNEAQELSQDVFIQAMQKISQLREPGAFGGWLRSITHRMAINRGMRRPPSASLAPETMEAVCVDHNTPLASALADERKSEVRAGLRRLGNLDRDTLVAFYVKGQSLIEMSIDFEAPVGTIKRRLHVARKRLAKTLENLLAV